jgi:hypothetical protein
MTQLTSPLFRCYHIVFLIFRQACFRYQLKYLENKSIYKQSNTNMLTSPLFRCYHIVFLIFRQACFRYQLKYLENKSIYKQSNTNMLYFFDEKKCCGNFYSLLILHFFVLFPKVISSKFVQPCTEY